MRRRQGRNGRLCRVGCSPCSAHERRGGRIPRESTGPACFQQSRFRCSPPVSPPSRAPGTRGQIVAAKNLGSTGRKWDIATTALGCGPLVGVTGACKPQDPNERLLMHFDFASDAGECDTQARRSIRRALEPRPSRYAAHQSLWLVRADGAISYATMTNVSRDGFGLTVSPAPASGERVILRGGAGDIPAEIRWSAGDRAGGLFTLPED